MSTLINPEDLQLPFDRTWYRRSLFWSTAFAAVILVSFGNCLNGPFQSDDGGAAAHPFHYSWWKTASLLWMANQRILANWTFVFNNWLSNTTTYHHLLNLAIHWSNGCLLYSIIRATLRTPLLTKQYGSIAEPLAGSITVLYLIHPLTTEAVSYIVQREQSLMAMFELLAMWSSIMSYRAKAPVIFQILAVFSFILCVDSKPHSLGAPALILIYERIFLAQSWKNIAIRSWPMYAGFAMTLIINIGLMVSHFNTMDIGGMYPSTGNGDKYKMSWFDYLLSQPSAICRYIHLSFIPVSQDLDYKWALPQYWIEIIPPSIIVITLIAVTIWALFNVPAIGFVAAWFWINIIPSSSIIPRGDICVEHRMYVPLQAIITMTCIAIVSLARVLPLERKAFNTELIRITVPLLLFVTSGALLCSLTIKRNNIYNDPIAMSLDILNKNPLDYIAYVQLGDEYNRRKQFDLMAFYYRGALDLIPSNSDLQFNVGMNYYLHGCKSLAIQSFFDSIKYNKDPHYSESHFALANLFNQYSEFDKAIIFYKIACQRNQDDIRARFGLGLLLHYLKRDTEAIIPLREVVEKDPFNKLALNAIAEIQHMDTHPDVDSTNAEPASRSNSTYTPR